MTDVRAFTSQAMTLSVDDVAPPPKDGDPWLAPQQDTAVPLGGWSKRLTDIAISVVSLTIAAPVMLLVAVLIRLTSEGPIVFSHTRVGFCGKPFKCYKFRTMVVNAEQVLEAYLAGDPQAAEEWTQNQKLRNDPRVNFVGQMLRKSSLDELPQLYNVLRGDMSCVGPRPVVQDEIRRYGPSANYYLQSRPGVTGLWQVTGRSSTDYDTRVRLDTQYVRDWSLWRDLAILCRTPMALTRAGEVC